MNKNVILVFLLVAAVSIYFYSLMYKEKETIPPVSNLVIVKQNVENPKEIQEKPQLSDPISLSPNESFLEKNNKCYDLSVKKRIEIQNENPTSNFLVFKHDYNRSTGICVIGYRLYHYRNREGLADYVVVNIENEKLYYSKINVVVSNNLEEEMLKTYTLLIANQL